MPFAVTQIIDNAMKTFNETHAEIPREEGPCAISDASVKCDFWYLDRVAICKRHRSIHYCMRGCPLMIYPAEVCRITLMPPPGNAEPAKIFTDTDSVLREYARMWNIYDELVPDNSGCTACKNWFSMPSLSAYVCRDHHTVHFCGQNACNVVDGVCSISGTPCEDSTNYSCRVRARNADKINIRKILDSVFAGFPHRKMLVDHWSSFIQEFARVINLPAVTVEIIMAIFMACSSSGLSSDGVQILPKFTDTAALAGLNDAITLNVHDIYQRISASKNPRQNRITHALCTIMKSVTATNKEDIKKVTEMYFTFN